MFNALQGWMDKLAAGKTVALLLSLTFFLMFLINSADLPNSVPGIKDAAKGGGLPDMLPFYTSEKAYDALEGLGSEGRKAYLGFLTTFDMVFPLVYSLALSATLALILRAVFPASAGLRKLILVPLAAGLFDYLENSAIIMMLLNYPSHLKTVASAAGYFTLGKWSLTGFSILLIFLGLLRWGWLRASGKLARRV